MLELSTSSSALVCNRASFSAVTYSGPLPFRDPVRARRVQWLQAGLVCITSTHGVSQKVVQERLSHARIGTTLDVPTLFRLPARRRRPSSAFSPEFDLNSRSSNAAGLRLMPR